jgi:hypothetical protein
MNKQEFIEKVKANGSWCNERPNGEIGRYVKISKVRELINQLDEPKKIIFKHDEIFVVKWFEEALGDKSKFDGNDVFRIVQDVIKVSNGLATWEDYAINEKLCNWIEDNEDRFIDLIVNCKRNYGYEVEKEQLYYVKIPVTTWNDDSSELETEHAYLILDVTSDETRLSHSNKDYGHWKARLTELDIKSIDERYWPFAVKVED